MGGCGAAPDLYRATKVNYEYVDGDDDWKSPFEHENATSAGNLDPRLSKPSPHQSFSKRIQQQTFQYDWLGNSGKTDDDVHGFYDRSLGTIENDTDPADTTTGSEGAQPYQLKSAAQNVSGGTHNGSLSTVYDPSGNLTELRVARGGPCLPTGASCDQVFKYEWDEVGRLNRARRWDVANAQTDPATDGSEVVDLRHYYDAGDQRVLKSTNIGTPASPDLRYTVYVFDSLELRRAAWAKDPQGSGNDYEYTEETVVGYLLANGVRLARLAIELAPIPSVNGSTTHVFFELGDHLGSTSIVLDKETGELVERGTFQAYGGAESDYRPERWAGFREDYRFTGKEEDVEVGLQYFGKRFLNPLLGRWVSADPLTIHGLGADLNGYAYVSGAVLKNIDPLGLAGSSARAELRAQENAERNSATYKSGAVQGRYQEGIDQAYNSARANIENRHWVNPATEGGAQGTHPNASYARTKEEFEANKAADLRTLDQWYKDVSVTTRGDGHLGSGSEAKNKGFYAGYKSASLDREAAFWAGLAVEALAGKGLGKVASVVIKKISSKLGPTLAKAFGGGRKVASQSTKLCFARGTLVKTKEGFVPIESVAAGNIVLARDDRTGEETWQAVTETFVTPNRQVLDLLLVHEDGRQQRLVVTPEHPIWSASKEGWRVAGDLNVDEAIETRIGPMRVVQIGYKAPRQTVYNFTVANAHTYFAGEAGVWVHNNPWEKIAQLKFENWDAMSAADQKTAERMIDTFQQRFSAGAGEKMSNIRNVKNLGGGLWEIKSRPGVRV